MGTITYDAPRARLSAPALAIGDVDLVQAAEAILRRFGARAVTILTAPRQLPDGRWIPARLSANDCYVALDEACRKMARVALRRYRQEFAGSALTFNDALGSLFPDPPAYLTRCVRSVVSDAARTVRREVPIVSLDQPLASDEDGTLCIGDTVPEERTAKLPEYDLLDREDRKDFRSALSTALKKIPANYLDAIRRDIAREREREAGARIGPESDRERQTICRARAALSEILRRECGADNPFVRLLAQQRSHRVRSKTNPSAPAWTSERQDNLFRKLLGEPWAARAQAAPDESVEEAVVNPLNTDAPVAPPSPEMRAAMRVMDHYQIGKPRPQDADAFALWTQAHKFRKTGKPEEAVKAFRACFEREPSFVEAQNEVALTLVQLGNLREALKIYLDIIERDLPGDHTYMAATNAADIYLTWFDAGRSRERNIELAIRYAKMAMAKPTPMRACNLLLAYVKDRYYYDAEKTLQTVLTANYAQCSPEKFLNTLFQIRDKDLIAWWNWLDLEMGKESNQ